MKAVSERSCFFFTWMLPCCVVGWCVHVKGKKKSAEGFSRRKTWLASTKCWRWHWALLLAVRQIQRISEIVTQQQMQSCICAILWREETTELFIFLISQPVRVLLVFHFGLSKPTFVTRSDILQLRCQSKGGKKSVRHTAAVAPAAAH